jgi:6-pyruvoyl-tetrahydropterin synthase-like protein
MGVATSIGVLCLVGVGVCAPMYWYGAPNGDDMVTALLWMKHFTFQLTHGDLYPRWLMDMNRGAGSPAFYFYAPLPFYIISVPALGLSRFQLTTQLAWGDSLLLTMSGLSFYLTSRRRHTDFAAVSASVLYMLLPYHFETDIWGRQDLGELTNYIWMPMVLFYADEILAGRDAVVGFAISYGLMVFTHLPSTLLFSICLGGYVLVSIRAGEWLTCLRRFSLAICIGLLLGGLYWVPALFNRDYIHAEAWSTWSYDFHLWFFPIPDLQVFRGNVSLRSTDIRMFTAVGISSGLFFCCWFVRLFQSGITLFQRSRRYLAMMLLALFLMTSWSTVVWENMPLLGKVQFPWRLAMVVDLLTATYFLYVVDDGGRLTWYSASAMVICVLALVSRFMASDLKQQLDPFYDPSLLSIREAFVRDGVDAPEYSTRWSLYDRDAPDNSAYLGHRNPLVFNSGHGSISIRRWHPRDIKLDVSLGEPTELSVRQFYFPNWSAAIDARTRIAVMPDKNNGLIALFLPRGKYSVDIKLEPLPTELSGATLTSAGTLTVLGTIAWQTTRRRRYCRIEVTNLTSARGCREDHLGTFL